MTLNYNLFMSREYFNIRDNCRKGLLKYLFRALSCIPEYENPIILDAGCGSGVPAIALAENLHGTVIAADLYSRSLQRLKEKVKEFNLSDRISIREGSIFDIEFNATGFDIIVAEGLLNVTGFERGFLKLISLLKSNRYIIIHDQCSNHAQKLRFIRGNNCEITESFILDEHVWWKDYYQCLEKQTAGLKKKELLRLFRSDLHEIELFKQDPSSFNSIYWVIKKK